MSKRRISKASKNRLVVFGTISLIAIVSFAFSLLYNMYTIYDLSREKQQLENVYTELQEKSEQLKIDIEKLNEPEYLANYARENYLYTKYGEYKLQINDDINETIETIDKISLELNKNYIILGISAFILLVIVFIRACSRKSKRN